MSGTAKPPPLPQTMGPYDTEGWLRSMKQQIEHRTGRRDVEVTGGPYRGYDIRVSEAADGHPIVDLYSPMRRDPRRVRQALDYAVRLIADWEATRAEHQAEMRAVRPIFERLQGEKSSVESRLVRRMLRMVVRGRTRLPWTGTVAHREGSSA